MPLSSMTHEFACCCKELRCIGTFTKIERGSGHVFDAEQDDLARLTRMKTRAAWVVGQVPHCKMRNKMVLLELETSWYAIRSSAWLSACERMRMTAKRNSSSRVVVLRRYEEFTG